MSKRQAANYLTKEPSRNRPEEDEESERDKVDPVQIASAEIMATRKYILALFEEDQVANACIGWLCLAKADSLIGVLPPDKMYPYCRSCKLT